MNSKSSNSVIEKNQILKFTAYTEKYNDVIGLNLTKLFLLSTTNLKNLFFSFSGHYYTGETDNDKYVSIIIVNNFVYVGIGDSEMQAFLNTSIVGIFNQEITLYDAAKTLGWKLPDEIEEFIV